jgi:hypothetical protein
MCLQFRHRLPGCGGMSAFGMTGGKSNNVFITPQSLMIYDSLPTQQTYF